MGMGSISTDEAGEAFAIGSVTSRFRKSNLNACTAVIWKFVPFDHVHGAWSRTRTSFHAIPFPVLRAACDGARNVASRDRGGPI